MVDRMMNATIKTEERMSTWRTKIIGMCYELHVKHSHTEGSPHRVENNRPTTRDEKG